MTCSKVLFRCRGGAIWATSRENQQSHLCRVSTRITLRSPGGLTWHIPPMGDKVAVHLVSGPSEDFTKSAEDSATNLSIFSMHIMIFTQPVCWLQWLHDWSTSYISCRYQCKHYPEDHCTLINLHKIGSEMASFAILLQRPPIIQHEFHIFHAEFALINATCIKSAFRPCHNEPSLYWYWVFWFFGTDLLIWWVKWRKEIWSVISSGSFALNSTWNDTSMNEIRAKSHNFADNCFVQLNK